MTMSAVIKGILLTSRLATTRTTKSRRGARVMSPMYSVARRTECRGDTATRSSSSYIVALACTAGRSHGSTVWLASALLSGMSLRWLGFCALLGLSCACSRSTAPVPGESYASGADLPSASAASVANTAESGNAVAPAPAPLDLDVIFSSEKKDWAAEALSEFNASSTRTDDGRVIQVHATFTGSVEPIEGIVNGTLKPAVFSPA